MIGRGEPADPGTPDDPAGPAGPADAADRVPRVAPPRRALSRQAMTRQALSRWADSVSAALPDGHISLDAVVAYVDGELPPTPARRAAAHVQRCLPCAMEVANQRQARQRLRAADVPGAPSTLLSTLRAIPERSDPEPSIPEPPTAEPLSRRLRPRWPGP